MHIGIFHNIPNIMKCTYTQSDKQKKKKKETIYPTHVPEQQTSITNMQRSNNFELTFDKVKPEASYPRHTKTNKWEELYIYGLSMFDLLWKEVIFI